MSRQQAGRPLRVALVTGSYNFIADGVALTLNRLVGYLESHGVEVLVFTPVTRTPAFAHKGEVVPVPSAPLPLRPEYRLALGFPRAQRERMRAFAPDIIHVATPDFLGHQALKFGLELGGKDPAYVTPDANLNFAVENLVDGAFFNSGGCR